MRSQSGDAIGVKLNAIPFRSLLRALRALPTLKIEESKQNPISDEAFATFTYKGIRFEVDTPLSDYWIDKPENCPDAVFEEIAQCLERFRVPWWHWLF
jgi:hypothetical protein